VFLVGRDKRKGKDIEKGQTPKAVPALLFFEERRIYHETADTE